jgi:hypothetical protein
MDNGFQNLERFVQAVHRRAVFWRIVERAGSGLTIGAVAAIVLLGVTLSRGDDGRLIAAILVVAGTIAGLLNGIFARPTRFDAVAEADRQLRLHDLLTTATTVANPSDPWANLVVVQADRRAQSLNPRDVILQQYGVRAWGGVGIVTATVAVLSALTTTTPKNVMATPANDVATVGNVPAKPSDAQFAASSARSSQPFREGTSQDRSLLPGNESSNEPGSSSESSGQSAASTGTSQGQTDTPTADSRDADRASTAVSIRPGERVGGGDGRASTGAKTGDASHGAVADGFDTNVAPGGSGGARIAGETSPVRLDSVPDAYRDVVRSYFGRRDGAASR